MNSELNTVAVKLRLSPDAAAILKDRAAEQEMGISEYISALLVAMRDNPTVTAEALLDDIRGPF